MNQSRDVMADIISAKCFGCGHVVKVPSALGGKKARCPQCTNTIVIPTSADSNAEIVSDDQLPEVAREGEVLDGEEVAEGGDEIPEAEEVEDGDATRTGSRRRTRTRSRGTRVRKKGSGPRHPKVGLPPSRKKSSSGVVVGVVIAVVVLGGIIAAVALSGGSGPARPATPEVTAKQQASDQEAAKDHDLQLRCEQYTAAVNGGHIGRIQDFFKKGDNAQDILRAVTRMVEQGTRYENVTVKSASAASGQTTFTYSSGSGTGEKTLQWEKVDGKWLLTGLP